MGQSLPETNQCAKNYDEVPYESACCRYVHPDFIYSRALKLGLKDCPSIKEARVLEIGCGTGTDLIPFAIACPDAECFGIDLSQSQIETAQSISNALNLENIEFETIDLHDLDIKTGSIDYIMCHGVFSWVPDETRHAILKLCSHALSEHGIACISYSALPGSYFDKAAADMAQFHTKNSGVNSLEDAARARDFIQFAAEHAEQDSPLQKSYKAFLEEEASALAALPPSYICHDHLYRDKKALYLKDFVEMAAKEALYYAGSAQPLPSSNNTAQKEFLDKITDPVEREQYKDFFSARRFHISLLTKQNVQPVDFDGTAEIEEPAADFTNSIGDKPLAHRLARQQALHNTESYMLTNMRRESVKSTLFLNLLVTYCNGNNSIDDIAMKLAEHALKGDITLRNTEGKPIKNEEMLVSTLKDILPSHLGLMAQNGLIEQAEI